MNSYHKDQESLDHLFKETLANHQVEPAPELWKGIQRKLLWRELVRFNFTNLPKTFWFVGTGILLLVPAILLLTLKPAGSSQSGPTAQILSKPENIKTGKTASKPENIKTGNTTWKIHTPAPVLTKSRKTLLLASNARLKSTSVVSETPEFSSFPVNTERFDIDRMDRLNPEISIVYPTTDTILTFYTPEGILKVKKGIIPPVQFFSAQLGIQPEVSFYNGESPYTKTNFWINTSFTWHISRFSMATGVGLGYVYDQGKYRVEYKSRDSVGFYTSVTSFTVNGNNQIEYVTETKNVYDSLQHLADDRTLNKYTYIQIPFLMGYRLFESKRVNLTLQAGPAVSFLIGTREAEPVINYPNARIIKIESETSPHVKTNWQVWANLYLEYQVTRKISFYIAPSCQYYLNPMVKSENIRIEKPWSVGLGIGVQYNFGHKIRK